MIKRIVVSIENLFTRVINFIMTLFFIVIFLIVFTLVLLRYVFSMSLFGGAEFITVLFIYASAFGAAILFRERKHIRISFFIEKLPVSLRKVVIVLSYVLNMIFHIFLIYFALEWIQSTGEYRTAILGIPHGLMQHSITVYASIVIVYIVRNIILIVSNKQNVLEESVASYEGS